MQSSPRSAHYSCITPLSLDGEVSREINSGSDPSSLRALSRALLFINIPQNPKQVVQPFFFHRFVSRCGSIYLMQFFRSLRLPAAFLISFRSSGGQKATERSTRNSSNSHPCFQKCRSLTIRLSTALFSRGEWFRGTVEKRQDQPCSPSQCRVFSSIVNLYEGPQLRRYRKNFYVAIGVFDVHDV